MSKLRMIPGFRKKTELDDDFLQQKKVTSVTKSVSETLVKQLSPGSGGMLGFGKTKGGSEEEKKADAVTEDAQKLMDASGMFTIT